MARDTPLGMEFMNWQNAPSLTEAIAGGKSPLLKGLGILLADGGQEKPVGVPAPGLGQGVSLEGGVGVAPGKSSGLGISQNQFAIPNLTLPQIGQPSAQQGVDIDGDGQIDSFWGFNK